jgi:hypothetical protein
MAVYDPKGSSEMAIYPQTNSQYLNRKDTRFARLFGGGSECPCVVVTVQTADGKFALVTLVHNQDSLPGHENRHH